MSEEKQPEENRTVTPTLTGRVVYQKHASGVWIIGKEGALEGTTVMIPKVYPGTSEFIIFPNEKAAKEAARTYQKLVSWSIQQLKEAQNTKISGTSQGTEEQTEVSSE